MKYVELRHHSDLSMGVACGTVETHVDRVAELEQGVICLTETDSIRGVHALHKACDDKEGVRPIYGVEITVVGDHRLRPTQEQLATVTEGRNQGSRRKLLRELERDLGLSKTRRLCLRAATNEGVVNLFKLTSKAWTDGLYSPEKRKAAPRVDLALVAEHSEGLTASAGGPEDLIGADIVAGDYKKAGDDLEALVDIFGDRLSLELHPHPGRQKKVNRAVAKMASSFDVPLIATNDVLYVNEEDTGAHEVYLCISRRGMTLDNPDHPRSPKEHHVRTAEEMIEAFKRYHDLDPKLVKQAVARSAELADELRGELDADPLKALIPKLSKDPHKDVIALCREGWKRRRIKRRAKRFGIPISTYVDRLTS